MNNVVRRMDERMAQVGYSARCVSIEHLAESQGSVAGLISQGSIDTWLHEKWHFYLKTNDSLPEARTIIVVAMPQPFTRVSFLRYGTTYHADVAPSYFTRDGDSRAEEILASVLQAAGEYEVKKAHLALKTLAVRSGLAKYGRNNISYVSGMGSMLQLVAFYTDWPCAEDRWEEPDIMELCENCSLCRENCPTESMPIDCFLIRAENCLGSLVERNPDDAPWVRLQPDCDNALVGCMRCQSVCPANRPHLQEIVMGPHFSEEETELILGKIPWEELPPTTQQKLAGTRTPAGFYSFIAAHLGALIEKQRVSQSH